MIRRPGDTCEVRKEFLDVALQAFAALRDAAYVVRNTAGTSAWHKAHGWRQPGEAGEDFIVWSDEWALAHPVVQSIADEQDAAVAQAIEAGTADTQSGSVHESAVTK